MIYDLFFWLTVIAVAVGLALLVMFVLLKSE